MKNSGRHQAKIKQSFSILQPKMGPKLDQHCTNLGLEKWCTVHTLHLGEVEIDPPGKVSLMIVANKQGKFADLESFVDSPHPFVTYY